MFYRVLFIFRFLECHNMPCLDLRLSNCGTDVDFTSSHCHHVMMPQKKRVGFFFTKEFITVNDHLVSLNCQPPSSSCAEAQKWHEMTLGLETDMKRNNENNTRYMAFTMLKNTTTCDQKWSFFIWSFKSHEFPQVVSVAMWDFFGVPCLHEDVPWTCCPSSGVDMSIFLF